MLAAAGYARATSACTPAREPHAGCMRQTSKIAAIFGVLASSLLAFAVDPVPHGGPALGSLGQGALTPVLEDSQPERKHLKDNSSTSFASHGFTARHSTCQLALDTAAAVGWLHNELDELEALLWRESRCTARAFNRNKNGTSDRGVSQINDVNVDHLISVGVIDGPEELFDLATNLTAALALRHRDRGLCAWEPPEYCND